MPKQRITKEMVVDGAQYDAERGSAVGFAVAFRPKIEGDRRVDAHAEADAHGVCKILQGKDEGDGGHGALVPLRDEVTVHNVVERADEHGEDDGKRHLQHEGKDGLFFHEGLIHKLAPLGVSGVSGGRRPGAFSQEAFEMIFAAKKPRSGGAVWRKDDRAGKIHNDFRAVIISRRQGCGQAILRGRGG